MHLKSLKVFCDVVSRRSFSRAAEENGISQSGASQMVNHLEEHLGVKLIDRTKRPFVLTPEGEAYYDGCRKIVRRYFALEEEVKTLHEEVAGRVSVASIYSIGLSHMPRLYIPASTIGSGLVDMARAAVSPPVAIEASHQARPKAPTVSATPVARCRIDMTIVICQL